jgi:hypothetical protein
MSETAKSAPPGEGSSAKGETTMRTYAKRHAPSALDGPSNYVSWDREAEDSIAQWLVLPCGRNRDSECFDESNFAVAVKMLGGEGENVQIHRFGHWACGWYELIVVRPDTDQAKIAHGIEESLENYPLLDDDDFSEREQVAADETWKNCFRPSERLEYVRKHRSQFEFHTFADLLGCIRGNYFAGYASELLG